MGFYSWKTQDTERSISNSYSVHSTFEVTMSDDKGSKWIEYDYEGYGIFGGKDYYELLAEMNGLSGRDAGITLEFSGKPFLSPNLNESQEAEWKDEHPESCPEQGYFYCEDDDDDYEEEEDEEINED